jgi:hypothetical protein
MTNKYLEKIAKELGNDEGKSRSRAWGTFGRSVGFGTLASPIPGGSIVGGVYGYRTGIKKHAPHIKEEHLTRHAIRGFARQQGRGLLEAIGGGGIGAAAGAGVGYAAGKLLKSKYPGDAAKIGAGVAGIVSSTAGAIHGSYKSTKNKLDELHGKKK